MASKSARRDRSRAQRRVPPPPRTGRRPVQAPKRRESERRRPLAGLSRSPRRLAAYALVAGVVGGTLLVGFSLISAQRESTSAPATAAPGVAVRGIAETAAMLDGVPQRGDALGAPDAPVRLVEYTELQCPFCARFAVDVLPTLVREYVRPGKVEVVVRGLAFIGPDSVTALRTAAAAGAQNRLWNTTELLFANQGPENAWVSEELLRSVVTATGADVNRVFAERDGAAVGADLDSWSQQAQADGVTSTPTFFVGRRGETLERLALGSMDVAEFRAALDAALAR